MGYPLPNEMKLKSVILPSEITKGKNYSSPQTIEEKIRDLDRFMGDLDEYISFKHAQGSLSESGIIEIMDTGKPFKFVIDVTYSNLVVSFAQREIEEKELLIQLVENGCIGLINYRPFCQVGQRVEQGFSTTTYSASYGTPVRIKRR